MLEKLPAGTAVGTILHPTVPRQVPEPTQSSAGDCAARLRAALAMLGMGNVPRKILLQKRQRALLPEKKQEKDMFL